MQNGHVTTPFGRRRVSLALVKGQFETADRKPGMSVNKWKVFRDACEAREALGIQDRTLAVLNALLSFYPETDLVDGNGLVVFPSNAQLSVRAHGIAGTTLRRHLAVLVEAGLIQRRDSPNGKRYAHRTRDGELEDAFGFSLAPLLARSAELEALAAQIAEEKRLFRRAKESLTLCRRDVRKLLSAAMEEGAEGNWAALEDRYIALIGALPRHPVRVQVDQILASMDELRAEIVNLLENQIKSQKEDGSDIHFGQHIQNSKPESINENEPAQEKMQERKPAAEIVTDITRARPFPLNMILKACPQIIDYGPEGRIGHWRELMDAAITVRSMLGVSPSAWQEACDAMGPENAATAIACILERVDQINSAGGYLRDLTRRAARGEFSTGPMLMALMRNATAQGQRSA